MSVRAITAVNLLETLGGDNHAPEWVFANAIQKVLIHGYIDPKAILHIVPWTQFKAMLQDEYLQRDFLVPMESLSIGSTFLHDYSWHLAVSLRKRYGRYGLTRSAVALSTHVLSRYIASADHDSAEIVNTMITFIIAVGLWMDRPGGPHNPDNGQESVYSQIFRGRIVDMLIRSPHFKEWNELVRLELRMEQIMKRYEVYKKTVAHGGSPAPRQVVCLHVISAI